MRAGRGPARSLPARAPVAWRSCLALLAAGLVWALLGPRVGAERAFPDVPPGTWVELPDTRLDSVLWRDGAGRSLSALKGSGGPASIVTAWNGAAWDEARDLLFILAAGGDSDYAGNEVYAFDLAARRWRREFDPTVGLIPYLQRLGPQESDPKSSTPPPSRYTDANGVYPASRHTYNGLTHMPSVNRTWVAGGSRWWAGAEINDVFLWDHPAKRWEYLARDPLPAYFLGIVSTWDSVRSRVLYHDAGRLRAFDPSAPPGSRHSTLDDGQQPNDTANRFYTALFDPRRRRFVMAGPRGLFYYDFAAGREGSLKRRALRLGGAPWPQLYAPGFAHDPVGDRYAAYGGGNRVYFVDPDTGAVTVETGGGAVMTPAPPNGTFGRFRFSRSRGVFLVVNGIDQNVRVYRPAARPQPGR
ncbi:MAG: hypothetical protein HYV93_13945 [Candidatus Rokubacteria bacterium]|nr:hypothetical protein [Candidatus Rokubacteria bacterium]